MVFKNTGIPLGILAGPSESSNLYSLFFESLRILDDKLFNDAIDYIYVTDEHKCFENSYEKIGNLTTISLPSHSSHISQMLDATVFSPLKKRYASLSGNKKFNSQLIKKLMQFYINIIIISPSLLMWISEIFPYTGV